MHTRGYITLGGDDGVWVIECGLCPASTVTVVVPSNSAATDATVVPYFDTHHPDAFKAAKSLMDDMIAAEERRLWNPFRASPPAPTWPRVPSMVSRPAVAPRRMVRARSAGSPSWARRK